MLNKNYKLLLTLMLTVLLNSNNVIANETVSNEVTATKNMPVNTQSVAEKTVEANTQTTNKADNLQAKEDAFDFDLKMKNLNNTEKEVEVEKNTENNTLSEEAPAEIEYKSSPIDDLGNSVLSKIDSDLFSQMSEIEKSTTLLTLELRREKLKNEIEAQKAIRQKAIDDVERQKSEEALKKIEREKKLEEDIIKEQQILINKQQVFEIFKQRKLLNEYMNQMLIEQQNWLKEKEALYNEISLIQKEKKNIISLFKERIDKVLIASANNNKIALEAKANFNRIVKNLKAKNEQLRKRIEADALIIKENQKIINQRSQSTDSSISITHQGEVVSENTTIAAEEIVKPSPISSNFAILGISGRGNKISAEVINIDGQTFVLKIGSVLPTGHSVNEIGADYIRFSKDNDYEYLFIGKGIDGVAPTLGLTNAK